MAYWRQAKSKRMLGSLRDMIAVGGGSVCSMVQFHELHAINFYNPTQFQSHEYVSFHVTVGIESRQQSHY